MPGVSLLTGHQSQLAILPSASVTDRCLLLSLCLANWYLWRLVFILAFLPDISRGCFLKNTAILHCSIITSLEFKSHIPFLWISKPVWIASPKLGLDQNCLSQAWTWPSIMHPLPLIIQFPLTCLCPHPSILAPASTLLKFSFARAKTHPTAVEQAPRSPCWWLIQSIWIANDAVEEKEIHLPQEKGVSLIPVSLSHQLAFIQLLMVQKALPSPQTRTIDQSLQKILWQRDKLNNMAHNIPFWKQCPGVENKTIATNTSQVWDQIKTLKN